MSKVTIEKPQIISLLYQQEKTDTDYGSCLWARFYLDLKNYTMSIESDCGNYTYGWAPTPKHESFLHLCARFNKDYLLDKFSSRTVLDHATTYKRATEAVKEALEYYDVSFEEEEREELYEKIKDACYSYETEQGVYIELSEVLKDIKGLRDEFGFETIAGFIETDYPTMAKRIVEIYDLHIKPVVKGLAKEEADNKEALEE